MYEILEGYRLTHFYAMLSRMRYINRWGLMRNTRDENISEHSLETAIIAHALALIGNKRLDKNYNADRVASLAMFHDVTEIITGDLPTPIKYHNPKIKTAYKEVEKLAVLKLVDMLPEDLKETYEEILSISKEEDKIYKPLIKAADKISAVIKCIEEKKSGNMEFDKARQSLITAVKDLNCEEANIFIKEALGSYELTLDELE